MTDFIFWGLFLILSLIVISYIVWMRWIERKK